MKNLIVILLFLFLAASAFAADPVAVSFSAAIAANSQTTIQLQGSDADATPLTFATVATPSHGSVSNLNTSTGVIVYTPTAGYTGSDSFTYKVTSGGADSATATVSITVTTAKTRIVHTLLKADATPYAGTVTFLLTQTADSPGGLIPAKSSVSATLNGSGQFDVQIYPTKGLSPVQYYQVYLDEAITRNQIFLGVYNIPAATTSISLNGYRITNTNLAAQYTFASKAEVDAMTAAVAAATTAQLYPSLTSGKLIYWNGTTFDNSIASQSGGVLTITGSQVVSGTITAAGYVGITSANLPSIISNKTFDNPTFTGTISGTLSDSNLPTTLTNKTLVNPTISGSPTFAGTITATAFVGDCSACTGIGIGTSTGHSAAGSVTISADNDSNGSGVIDLQTALTTRMRVAADYVTFFLPLDGVALKNNTKITYNGTGSGTQVLSKINAKNNSDQPTHTEVWQSGVQNASNGGGALIPTNSVYWNGYNVSAPAVPINNLLPAFWSAWETSYDPGAVTALPQSNSNGYAWLEAHLLSYRNPGVGGTEKRLISFTITPATGNIVADFRASGFTWYKPDNTYTMANARGDLGVYGDTITSLRLVSETPNKTIYFQNNDGDLTIGSNQNLRSFSVSQFGTVGVGDYAAKFTSVDDRYNTILDFKNTGTSLGASWPFATWRNRSNTLNSYSVAQFDFNAGSSNPVTIGAQLTNTGSGYGDFLIWTRDADWGMAERLRVTGSAAKLKSGVNLEFPGRTYANLGSDANQMQICTDCAVTSGSDNTCTSGGSGALAVRINSVWRCFNAQN